MTSGKERRFDLLARDYPTSDPLCCYFLEGAAPASFVVQNAVVGVVKEQTQLDVGQGLVALHVPPHVATPLTPLSNCRAETVPAQRTAIAMTANDRFWIFFFMA